MNRNTAGITRWHPIADALAHAGLWLVVGTVSVSTLLGLLAAAVGSDLTALGGGPGGGWGLPSLLLTLAMRLGLPALTIGISDMLRGRATGVQRTLAFWGPLLIGAGFISIAHTPIL